MQHTKYSFYRLQAVAFVVALAIAFIPIKHSEAYAKDQATLEQEFKNTFNLMLKDPSNIDVTIAYAELAVELGDYESAIPPLERLLMFNPNLTEVKLEVGVLYYLLNSHAISREYLQDVKIDQAATPEMVQRANDYLARM